VQATLELWKSFFIAFSALLPIINPLGSALVFLGLVGNVPAVDYRILARKIAVNNVIFLLIIELLGSTILHFFGISLHIVQVAGGLVLAAMGWSVLNQAASAPVAHDKTDGVQADSDDTLATLQQKAFYPFTFPVTSGPGTLVVMLTLSTRGQGEGLALNLVRHSGLFLAVVVLSALVYVCYANASRLTQAVPPATAQGILRVVSFILMCIGVQIAWNGFAALLTSVIHP
jgi:multiple antibiotic resistance protein